MKFCIAGKNNIAVNILEYLIFTKKINANDIYVCCNKNEDGNNNWQRSLRFAARKLGVQEVNLQDVYDISNLVFLSLEFDRILRPCKFKSNLLFNIHFSQLPKYKGMYTAVLPLLNSENEGGVTFHKIDDGIDTGDIIKQKNFNITSDMTSKQLYLKCIEEGTELVKECIDNLIESSFSYKAYPQNFNLSSYFSVTTLNFNKIVLDLNQTAKNIKNQVRAFNFREYQLIEVFGKKIFYVDILPIRSVNKPGLILWENDEQILISTIDYDIVLYIDQFEKIVNACKKNDISILKQTPHIEKYLDEKEEHGWTLLTIAVYNGYYELAMYLISMGSDIYVRNNNGTTLLMYAKDCFIKTGDGRLFDYFYNHGMSFYDKDYTYTSLKQYCINQNITNILKYNIEE